MEKESTGITNLDKLIRQMQPVLNEGAFVFATVTQELLKAIPREATICEFKEEEGVTVIVSKDAAMKFKLPFSFVASWITLNVHSALEAVGLTAAFSSALGQHGISCNIVAGYYHDHIFVDIKDSKKAMEVLTKLSKHGLSKLF